MRIQQSKINSEMWFVFDNTEKIIHVCYSKAKAMKYLRSKI